ncbi:hypothetical protein [Pseudomonas reinekei]
MPPVNATATTSPTVSNPGQTALPTQTLRLSGATVCNISASGPFQLMPKNSSVNSPAPLDSQAPIPPPALCTHMFGPEEGAISNQASLNKAWASIEHRLRTQSMSERDVLQTLKSGILQTPTGKELAPLFLEAIMRSIKPPAGLTSERLREFVDCICTLPPDRWLDTFGENTYFARDGLDGYIQSELTIARAHRGQQITAGEFLDNDTWNALRDFTQQARTFIGLASDGQLNETLSQLEDFIDVRPPLKEAKTLVDRFLRAMCKPDANEAAPWGTGFATAQKLSDQINAIQTGDTPQRSLHEVITATKSQKATHSENASRYFVFGSPTDSTSTQKSQNKLTFSKLLSLLQEIEKKASFFSEVDTEGPRYTGGVGGKLTFVVNALGTIGGEILSAARHGKPATGRSSMSSDPDTAVGFPLTYADVCMNPSFDTYTGQSKIREQDTGATSTGDLNQLSLKDGYAWKVSLLELEAVVNDFIASIKPPPVRRKKSAMIRGLINLPRRRHSLRCWVIWRNGLVMCWPQSMVP